MPLLKEQNADLVQHEAIVLDLGDLRKQAEQIKRKARAEAAQLLQAAREEAARLTAEAADTGRTEGLEQGRAQGLEEGRQAGHAEALQQTSAAIATLQAGWTEALAGFEAERSQMMLEARQSMLELAIAIAAKVVKRMPQVDPAVVTDQLAAAIDQMARPADASIHVHPEDRPLAEEALAELAAQADTLQHVRWVEDATLARGGCRVTYGRACIDATLDRQLQRIVEALLPSQTGEEDAQASDGSDA